MATEVIASRRTGFPASMAAAKQLAWSGLGVGSWFGSGSGSGLGVLERALREHFREI